jgi:hypothetical protein
MEKKKKIQPIHPGEILLEEFLKPMGLSQNRLANDIGVPHAELMKLCMGNAGLQPTQRSVWDITSKCHHSFGLVYKWIMILILKKIDLQRDLTKKLMFMRQFMKLHSYTFDNISIL